MHPFREVKVWEKAHQVCLHAYKATEEFPKPEQYGLTAQIRRVAVAVPSKIAEGCGRGADKDLARFLGSAQGYATELEYQLLVAKELGYLPESEHAALGEALTEVQKMLFGFLKTVRTRLQETTLEKA